jgi:hypothetical protein
VTNALATARDGEAAEHAGHIGLAARGVLYLLVAFLAAQMAFGANDQPADKKGALRALADHPVGKVALVALTIGLAAYALWRVAEAVGRKDEVTKRLASAGKAALYASAAATAASTFLDAGSGSKDGNQQSQTLTARVLDWPGGRLIVGAAGVVGIGVGAYLVWRGVTRKFEEKLKLGEMPPPVHKAEKVLGLVGYSARGVVAALLGLLLVRSALHANAQEAQGIDGTLRTIAAQSYGQVLLLIAAAGLAAFGLHSLIEARYRRT